MSTVDEHEDSGTLKRRFGTLAIVFTSCFIALLGLVIAYRLETRHVDQILGTPWRAWQRESVGTPVAVG